MRKIILALTALMLFGGIASADRWGRGRGRDTSNASGGTVVRDHRGGWRDNRATVRRDYDRGYTRHRVDRRPVYVNNGRYVFNGGVSRVYNRPIIRHRYYDVRYRPQIIVENYDPVPGYIWVAGNWNWNGYEWIWTSGYWAVDQNYNDGYYDSGYYDSGYNSGVTVQGGVYVQGGF